MFSKAGPKWLIVFLCLCWYLQACNIQGHFVTSSKQDWSFFQEQTSQMPTRILMFAKAATNHSSEPATAADNLFLLFPDVCSQQTGAFQLFIPQICLQEQRAWRQPGLLKVDQQLQLNWAQTRPCFQCNSRTVNVFIPPSGEQELGEAEVISELGTQRGLKKTNTDL